MRYERTVILQSGHFNGEEEYKKYWAYLDTDTNDLNADHAIDAVEFATNTHGHNFRVDVLVEGNDPTKRWLIADEDLVDKIKEWDNMNLSLHPDFNLPRLRATTENMAKLLCDKLMTLAKDPSIGISVTVWENADIKATHASWDDLAGATEI